MKRLFAAVSVLSLTLLASCDICTIAPSLCDSYTSVRLVNDGSWPITVTVYYSDEQLITKTLLTTLGTEVEVTVQPGESETISRVCDDLQAIIVDKAQVELIGTWPEPDSDVLRDGTDFGCGDTITFTFTHSIVPLDFDVSSSVSSS